MSAEQKKKRSQIIRILVSVLFLGALIFVLRGKLPDVMRAMKSAEPSYMIAALLLFLGPSIAILAYRLKLLFKAQQIKLGFFYLSKLRFIGYFFNNFLPSAVGGDFVVAYFVAKKTGRGIPSFTAVFFDRLVGFFAMFLLALGVVLFNHQKIGIPYLLPLLIGCIAFMLLQPLFYFSKRIARPFAVLVAWLPKKILDQLRAVYHAVYQYRGHPFVLLEVIGFSFIVQTFGILIAYLLAKALGMTVSFAMCFLLMPLIWVISLVPSLGGLGVREGAYVVLFASFGGSEKAFALSILNFGISVVASLIGGALYMFMGRVTSAEIEKMREEDMKKLEEENIQ